MTNNAHLNWQRLTESYDGRRSKRSSAYRAEVPGGWLVTVCAGKPSKRQLTALTFVPDAAHEWQLVAEIVPEAPEAIDSLKATKKKKKKKDKPAVETAIPEEHAA